MLFIQENNTNSAWKSALKSYMNMDIILKI